MSGIRIYSRLAAVLVGGLIGLLDVSAATPAPDSVQRIVTLAPSLGELAAELLPDAMERIVGVSEYTDYPPALTRVTSIGPYFKFSVERVVSLKPDLILATREGNDREQVLKLEQQGLRVLTVSTETLAEVSQAILTVGSALGPEATRRSGAIVEQIARGLERFRGRAVSRSKASKPLRVLIQVDQDPLVVAGKRAFLTDALRVVGAENIFGDLEGHYPRPALEEALKRDPGAILILAFSGADTEKGRAQGAAFQKQVTSWKAFTQLSAVRRGAVKPLYADALLRPGIRMLEGLSILERALYPEAASAR